MRKWPRYEHGLERWYMDRWDNPLDLPWVMVPD